MFKQTIIARKQKNPMGLKFIDLFAGLGGFHLALQKLGHECVFASELKEDLQQLYEINFGGGVIHGDILSIEPKDIPAHDIYARDFRVNHSVKQESVKDSETKKNVETSSLPSAR